MDSVRADPLPAALTGIGVTWLMARPVVRQNDEDDARAKLLEVARNTQATHEPFGTRIQDAMTAARQSVTQRVHDLRDGASDATRQLGVREQGPPTAPVASDQGPRENLW